MTLLNGPQCQHVAAGAEATCRAFLPQDMVALLCDECCHESDQGNKVLIVVVNKNRDIHPP